MRSSKTQLNIPKVLFEGRHDAGKKLAIELSNYINKSAVVLAIPNGGVPVAIEIAEALKADLEVIVCRKIPYPLNPERGMGAVADDGTIVLLDDLVREKGMTNEQIEYEANLVRANVKERSIKYKGNRVLTRISGRTAIIVDDGMASGITMMAAVASVRHRHPGEVVVAVPVAPVKALDEVRKSADGVITCAEAAVKKFYIADFYHYWNTLSDDEVIHSLEKWRNEHLIHDLPMR